MKLKTLLDAADKYNIMNSCFFNNYTSISSSSVINIFMLIAVQYIVHHRVACIVTPPIYWATYHLSSVSEVNLLFNEAHEA